MRCLPEFLASKNRFQLFKSFMPSRLDSYLLALCWSESRDIGWPALGVWMRTMWRAKTSNSSALWMMLLGTTAAGGGEHLVSSQNIKQTNTFGRYGDDLLSWAVVWRAVEQERWGANFSAWAHEKSTLRMNSCCSEVENSQVEKRGVETREVENRGVENSQVEKRGAAIAALPLPLPLLLPLPLPLPLLLLLPLLFASATAMLLYGKVLNFFGLFMDRVWTGRLYRLHGLWWAIRVKNQVLYKAWLQRFILARYPFFFNVFCFGWRVFVFPCRTSESGLFAALTVPGAELPKSELVAYFETFSCNKRLLTQDLKSSPIYW